ncbi:hypothetical protein SLEP1_g55390 [Rubroshorea leprosula]|uniref:Hcy-binding domain-containing protein n=1 Tax=Rubroshorea leprosula TaxID=152421 RepID=A0AAV5MJ35_9ROSI|nr:hypothetical protein SLEP1_g55390 [Rubroshorea leprosula]
MEVESFMTEFLRQVGGVAVIDGGLATELERLGADLNDPLWSAKCLLSSPHLVRSVRCSLSLSAPFYMSVFRSFSYLFRVSSFSHFGNARKWVRK